MMVSVCMITYGHEKYIRQAIEGVLMQDCNFELELIIADDCSPDNTSDIVEDIKKNHSNGSWVKYKKHVINKGMMPNFMWALDQCQGKYISLCDGDDYWTDPLKLQKQIDFLENNPDYTLCFHKVQILKKDGDIVEDYITKVPNNYEGINTLITDGNYIHTPSVVFRNVITTLPFEFKQVPFGDFFLYFILAHRGKLKYIEDTMAVYRSDIGLLSKMSERVMSANYVKLYSCMLSFTNNEDLKPIILDKQQEVLRSYSLQFDSEYWKLKNEYKDAFVSHHKLFKGLKYLQNSYWKFKTRSKKSD